MPDPFFTKYTVPPSDAPGMSVQNQHCIRYVVAGRMLARQGAMVAYRGDLQIRPKSQGVRKLVKRAITGEGVPLMEVEGHGEIWLADLAKNVFVVPGDGLTVAGKSVLCFDEPLDYEIRMVKGSGMNAGGLFNCRFAGSGSIAVTADGEPMVLTVTPDSPVRVDTDAVVGWSDSLETSMHRSESMKSMLKGGSGELYQLELRGSGSVIVQPSEGPLDAKGKGGIGDAIGEFLG